MPTEPVWATRGYRPEGRASLRQDKEPTQRLRITFAKGEQVKYISHLDMMRLWERVLRRANIPLLYSKGYNPRPKISIAAPLAVGFTGQREVMDLILERPISPVDFAKAVSKQLTSGISLAQVDEVYTALPSLQSQLYSADHRVIVAARETEQQMQHRIADLLRSEHLPRERRGKEYDLRPLIEELSLEDKTEEGHVLEMRLSMGERGTGRPDEVLAELGVGDVVRAIERTRLHFTPPADA